MKKKGKKIKRYVGGDVEQERTPVDDRFVRKIIHADHDLLVSDTSGAP